MNTFNTFRITFSDGRSTVIRVNASLEEAKEYYIKKCLNFYGPEYTTCKRLKGSYIEQVKEENNS